MKILLFPVLLILASGCTVAPKPPFTITELADCYRSQEVDSSRTATAIVGEWEWLYVECAWTEGNNNEFAGLRIEFVEDGSLSLTNSDGTIENSSWELQPEDNVFGLRSDPFTGQILGRIWVCDDRLVFNHSYIDGCDNYYRRR